MKSLKEKEKTAQSRLRNIILGLKEDTPTPPAAEEQLDSTPSETLFTSTKRKRKKEQDALSGIVL